jgi:hypothetical protein
MRCEVLLGDTNGRQASEVDREAKARLSGSQPRRAWIAYGAEISGGLGAVGSAGYLLLLLILP